MVEDATDSKQEGAPTDPRTAPFDLSNGASTRQNEKKKWKANSEAQGYKPIGGVGTEEAQNQPKVDIDLDPRMLVTLEKAGATGDTIAILVNVMIQTKL